MSPPRHGEGDRPKGGGGGVERVAAPPPSVSGATATSPARGGSSRIALAAVAGAHGVKGEVRLKLFTDSVDNLRLHDTVQVSGERRLEAVRPGPGGAIARLSGVADRSAAEALRGSLIEVDRDSLPPLEEGEYYHSDIIGLPCVDTEGRDLGRVIAIENFGASDVLEIERPDGSRSMVPFKDDVAELKDGRIVVDPEFLT